MTFEEHPDEEWVYDADDESDDVLVCPRCRADVHEDTQQCPHCGEWITPIYPRAEWKRWVWIVAVLFVVLSFILSAAL